MTDPYAVLGAAADWDDDQIRRRYLQLVREFTPEHHPEKFAAVRQAYELIRDPLTRLRYRLFEADKAESIDQMIEELKCQTRHRLSLKTLLSILPKL